MYMFKFKVAEKVPKGKAIQQLRDIGYAEKHRNLGCPIHRIGAEFSKTGRNIVGFEVETT